MENHVDLPNILKDRTLLSPLEGEWTPAEVKGSLYLTLASSANSYLQESQQEKEEWNLLHNGITGEKLAASDALTWGKRFASVFRDLGLGVNDTIHLIVGNFNLAYPACFGAWILGAVPSLGDVNLEARAVARQLTELRASILLFVPEFSDLAEKAYDMLEDKSQTKVLCFGQSSWCENIYRALDNIDPNECPESYVAQDPKKEPVVIFWSSGTTGYPKGIVHSHHSALNFAGMFHLTPKATAVTTTCFFHVGGFFTGITAMLLKQTYYHMFGSSFRLEHILRAIREIRPKQVVLGTHHYVQLAESDLLDEADPKDLESVEFVVPAGAAVPQSCETLMKKKFKNLKAVPNVYGQTELGLVSFGLSNRSLGTLQPGVRMKVVDPDTGAAKGPGEVGEICVRSSFGAMVEYLNRPKETREFFDSEGFGHTGDLGFYDDRGGIFYFDRMKEIMKYRNNHVAPTELEGILQRHPSVRESLVFGMPDPKVQEIVTAVVVLKPGHEEVSSEELVQFVNDQVTDYKRIRGGVIFRTEIPRNSVGKLVRRDLREWAKSQMARKE